LGAGNDGFKYVHEWAIEISRARLGWAGREAVVAWLLGEACKVVVYPLDSKRRGIFRTPRWKRAGDEASYRFEKGTIG